MPRIFLLLVTLLCAAPIAACLWDSDTLAQESAGLPDVKATIVGGFPRNPPLYFEMRLARVVKLLATNPDDLDAYDDAGVACDRLGRSDEAIEWMAKKHAALVRLKYDSEAHEQPNHHYRYLANLGTFHAHRWFKHGAKRDAMGDLTLARDLVKQAIEENSDAHFGREKYQLRAIEWIIQGQEFVAEDDPRGASWSERRPEDRAKLPEPGRLPNLLGVTRRAARKTRDDDANLGELNLAGAVEGLCGLIVQGNAWESVDVFYALALALQVTGRSSFAYMAILRVQDLVGAGRVSVVPLAPVGDDLLEIVLPKNGEMGLFNHLVENRGSEALAEYAELKVRAETWSRARSEYLAAKLKNGEHPDTQPEFWASFDGNPDRMDIPSGFFYQTFAWLSALKPGVLLALSLAFVIPLAILLYIYSRVRVRRRKAAVLPPENSIHNSFRLTR